jgi:hypothetical protein
VTRDAEEVSQYKGGGEIQVQVLRSLKSSSLHHESLKFP